MMTLAVEEETAESDLYEAMGLQVTAKHGIRKPRILSILSLMVKKHIQENETVIESTQVEDIATEFHGKKVPDIGIQQYIERMFTYSSCSPSCFVIAHIYLDRFFLRQNMYFTSFTAHRLLITAVMVAAKFMDDVVFNNAYYARVGGVSTTELNKLEMAFLYGIDFRLQVTTKAFHNCCLMLQYEVSSSQMIERPIQFFGANRTWSKKRI